jgi:hypothetical protein
MPCGRPAVARGSAWWHAGARRQQQRVGPPCGSAAARGTASVPPRPRLGLGLAVAAIITGVIGLCASAAGLVTGILPRHFTGAEQQKIMAWEIGKRWRAWPVGEIFLASITYSVPGQALDSPAGDLHQAPVGSAGSPGRNQRAQLIHERLGTLTERHGKASHVHRGTELSPLQYRRHYEPSGHFLPY